MGTKVHHKVTFKQNKKKYFVPKFGVKMENEKKNLRKKQNKKLYKELNINMKEKKTKNWKV